MGVYLNPGNGKFRKTINSSIYVDKTNLIRETNKVLNTEQGYICVSRPRRFGKSITANMLAAYYGKNWDSSDIFNNYKISLDSSYKEHLNKYNVIFINMYDFFCMSSSITKMLEFLQEQIIIDLKEAFPNIFSDQMTKLPMVLDWIYAKTQETFIFIIDEWDCILREKKYSDNDYKLYFDFIRNLLKDKGYVSLAYMTGILPVKKYGTHSALNMFCEYSMTDPGVFADYVGFTENEVKELCQKYQRDYHEMKVWYDGYIFPDTGHIYNPKSVVEAIFRSRFFSYWTQTETYEALKIYIQLNYDGLKDAVISMLAGGKIKIDTQTFQNDMTTFENSDDVLTLLVHLGYLAYDQESSSVFIPNSEVAGEFARSIRGCKWDGVVHAIENSEKLVNATLEMNCLKVAEMLDQIHQENTSILSYNDENSLSCVIALAYYSLKNEYISIREFPAGKGFADIIFLPKKHSDKPAIIVELKYNKSARSAIDQIKDREYASALQDYKGKALLVGVNYDKKEKHHDCVIEECFISRL